MGYSRVMTSTDLTHVTTSALTVATMTGEQLAGAWLASLRSENTRAAYRRDLANFVGWCQDRGVEPIEATRPVLDLYRISMEGDGLAASTIARRLSALGSFYAYAVSGGALGANPATGMTRPRGSDESPTLGLDKSEAESFLAVAAQSGARDEVLACLLLLNGLRVSEAVSLDVADLDTERGHRFVRVTGKGGKVRKVPLAPRTLDALDRATAGRTSGPIILANDGERMSRHGATRVVNRLSKAADLGKAISPHSCRHAYVTLSLDAGVPLRDVQDGAGHASPETTRRYDRARFALDRSPTYALSAFLGGPS